MLVKLDRIIINTEWEQMFPKSFIKVLPRDVSDHSPLVINFDLKMDVVYRPFKFELCWLLRPDLNNVVCKVWNEFHFGRKNIDNGKIELGI